MTTAVTTWLVLVVGASAAVKARWLLATADALSTYGIRSRRPALAAAVLLIACELGLAAAAALGVDGAPWALAALFALFALASSAALIAGRAGRPCACLGAGSRLSRWTPLRAVLLAAAAAALALGWLGGSPTAYERWLTIGLALSIAAIAVLALAVLALAREIGALRLAVGGGGALEIEQEGPPLGSRQPWATRIAARPAARLRLAVFTSEGCPLCRTLEPAIRHVAADPLVALDLFDEQRDPSVWSEAGIPGSPYAIALSLGGVALAKGTFNSLGQLESILATALARERDGQQGLELAA